MDEYRTYGEYSPSDRNAATTAITFLLVGLGIGALTALLMAPTTGRKMRNMVRRRYEDARESMGDWGERASEVWNRREEWADTARSKVEPMIGRMRRH